MARIFLRALIALVTAGLVLMPVFAVDQQDTSSSAPDPARISNYVVDYTVSSDGMLVAKETLTTEFPAGRHGIFRYWDIANPSDPHGRFTPKNISVELDGKIEPFELQWTQGRKIRVAKIGDPDAFVSPGTHTYTIRYTIKGVLSPGDVGADRNESSSWTGEQPDQSVFYWNLIPQGWSMAIDQSTINLTLPAPAQQVQCTTGFDSSSTCKTAGAGTDTVTVSTGALATNTPVTTRIALPIATPKQVELPWSVKYDRAFGTSVARLWMVVAVTLLLAAIGYALDRRAREERPGYPVTFEPPNGLGPVQTAYLTTEAVPGRGLVATLLYQAEQGLTTLEHHGDKSWTITGVGDAAAWAATDDVTRYVGKELGVTTPGAVFTSTPSSVESGRVLKAVRDALPSQTNTWAAGIGAQTTSTAEQVSRALVIMSLVALIIFGVVLRPPFSMYVLPWAGFAIGGAGLISSGVGKRRTTLGRDLWSRAGGFERMLSTNSAQDRFDFSARQDLYTAFIPFAVAFDCADRWARKYELSTGSPAPEPIWFVPVGGGASSSSFTGGNDPFASFESSLASSISAYTATQVSSSSSSGSGGGGFSGGGGGGGGGGGSW